MSDKKLALVSDARWPQVPEPTPVVNVTCDGAPPAQLHSGAVVVVVLVVVVVVVVATVVVVVATVVLVVATVVVVVATVVLVVATVVLVVATVVAGYPNKDIASHFSISDDTVKHHLSSIFDKLGVSNRLELALFAINHHLVAET